jgi:hypothetical protein
MKRFSLFLITLVLTHCAQSKLERMPLLDGGMAVRVPSHRVVFALPKEWRELTKAPEKTIFAAAADQGRLRMVLAGPLGAREGDKNALVADAAYQQGIQTTLRKGGYEKVVRSGLTMVSNVNSYACEAISSDQSQSILQVHVPHGNQLWLMTFHSSKPGLSKNTSVQKVTSSMQLVPVP